MANIRKQFNFRNGVQVDDDNLIVSPTGLVGIGTSVPTEALDVRGNLTVTGFATASELRSPTLTISGNATIGSLEIDTVVASGVMVAVSRTYQHPSGLILT